MKYTSRTGDLKDKVRAWKVKNIFKFVLHVCLARRFGWLSRISPSEVGMGISKEA